MTDTVKLLRECDSGAKTAVNSITEMLDKVKSPELLSILTKSLKTHQELQVEIGEYIMEIGAETKDPPIMAKAMSWLKTNIKMLENNEDSTIADLMLDGCNMGIKQLCGYVNDYKGADEKSQSLAKKIIKEEEHLIEELKNYL